MNRRLGPHDFLLHLRTKTPLLARRLDGISRLELAQGTLLVHAPAESWTYAELGSRSGELERAASAFFGRTVRLVVEPSPAGETLPFPLLATKAWNHVAFWAWSGAASAVLAVPKPAYVEQWLGGEPPDPAKTADLVRSTGKSELRRYVAPGVLTGMEAAAWVLPDVLDDLCALAREAASYAQLLCAFPGDAVAEFLEGRLYGAKEWGTPSTPGPVLQKYVGRLHYASPELLGLRMCRAIVQAENE
jgi:hypothetical protein